MHLQPYSHTQTANSYVVIAALLSQMAAWMLTPELLPELVSAVWSFSVLWKESFKRLKAHRLCVCVCIYIRIPVSGNKPKTGGFNKTYQKGATEEAFRFSWYWRWKWWQLLRTRYTMSVIITHSPSQAVVLTSNISVTSGIFRRVMRSSCHDSAC